MIMERKDFSGLEEQIMGSVQNAIDSMDFKNLNRKIADTVNVALDETRSQLIHGLHAAERKGQDVYRRNYRWRDLYKRDEKDQDVCRGNYKCQTTKAKLRVRSKEDLRLRRPGRLLGILFIVLGGMGLGAVLVLFPVIYLVALAIKPFWGGFMGASLLLLILGIAFASLMGTGIAMGKRLKRARLYLQQAGSRLYCGIEELAGRIGRSRRFVAKDLQQIIEKGILPTAHIDEQKTCLMLDDETYRQYLAAQGSLKQRELLAREEKREKGRWPFRANRSRKENRLEQEGPSRRGNALQKGEGAVLNGLGAEEEAVVQPKGLQEMMEQGRNYLKVLQEANDAIPGEAISGKLKRLEIIIRRIFDTVERKPEQMEEMERFMDYYLPTTVKLVTAYRDFDRVEIEGENIASAKHEIEETLDTINAAFERLLDDLYQTAAMDVVSDASVLQTMLKKDGFAESDFSRRDE